MSQQTHTTPHPAQVRPRASLLRRLATVSYRRRRLVVLAWLVLTGVLLSLAGTFGGDFDDAFELPGSDSQRALDLLSAEGFATRAGSQIMVVVRAEQGVEDPAVEAAVEQLLAGIAADVGQAEITSPYQQGGERQVSADGRIAYAQIDLADRDDDLLAAAAKRVVARVDAFQVPGVQVALGGDSGLLGAQEGGGSEAVGFLAAIVILLVAFGSVLAMGLPLLTALFGIGCGVALVQLAANLLTMPTFTVQLVIMLGIGVGIDYALFVVTRYRQGLADGLGPEAAVVRSIDTAGRAVLFAGVTVVISVLGLFAVGLDLMRSLATAAAVGVLMTMLAAITLLPAVLGFVGRAIDRLGLPHRRAGHGRRDGLWFRWSRVLQRHPVPALVIGLVLLVALAVPLLSMRLGFADAGNRPEGDTTRQAYDLLSEGFGPGFNGPLVLAAHTPGGPADLRALAGLGEELTRTDGVAAVSGPIPNERGDAAVMQVVPTTSPQDEATAELVHELRDDVIPAAIGGSRAEVFVGGSTAAGIDFAEYAGARLPWFVGSVLVLSFLVLMTTFRSLLVPLKAVVMNLLSIGAAYGVVVAVFQWGWGASLLGVGEPGPIEAWAPLMLFAIVFGLSMDYEVFLLSRMREEYDRTGDNALAVADGLAATARVITAAAAIMVSVFAGFMLSPDRALQLFGLGLATAVLVDATIVRLVLVPATMELLGDRNWWLPRWLGRLLPPVHIEAPDGLAAPAALRLSPDEKGGGGA